MRLTCLFAWPHGGRRVLAAAGVLALLGLVPTVHAQDVLCHLSYGGTARTLQVPPSRYSDEVMPQLQGASFEFQVLNRVPPEPGAGVQVRSYSRVDERPFLLHQGTYWDTSAQGPHGFSGLQTVRDPRHGHELVYWCERIQRERRSGQ